jgi:hypothetical protein
MSLGDALVADAVERWAPATTAFVSWDADHFRGKLAADVMTPIEYLRARRSRG